MAGTTNHYDADDCETERLRASARALIAASRTPRHAAHRIGISREALLGFAAGAYVRPRTEATLREKLVAIGYFSPM